MAAFCRWWRISPAEYWALTVEETAVMTKFANDENSERERAQRRAAQQARIRRRG